MEFLDLSTGKIAYKVFGGISNPCIVIETALAASCAEWWHIAEKWSTKYCVLVYDRAGYGQSYVSTKNRSPENICSELHELLDKLNINRIILIGHSIGGLYAYEFTKLYPDTVRALILLDPVSSENGRFEAELSKEEFKKSGVEKGKNLGILIFLSSFKLARIILRSLLKKSPPFYYYKDFPKDDEKYILNHLTSKKMYRTAVREYSYIEDRGTMEKLKITPNSISIPVFLICHTPEIMKKEIEYYGNATSEVSGKVEHLWSEIMKTYLKLSEKSEFIQAKNSSHSIHLTDPESIWYAIEKACTKQSFHRR